VDRARPPAAPASPTARRYFPVGVIGLPVGLGLAFVREHMDNTKGHATDRRPSTCRRRGGTAAAEAIVRRCFARTLSAKNARPSPSGQPYPRAFCIPMLTTRPRWSGVLRGTGRRKTTLSTIWRCPQQLGCTPDRCRSSQAPRRQGDEQRREGGLVDYVAGVKTLQQCVISDPSAPICSF
jgi:hypothetical protein